MFLRTKIQDIMLRKRSRAVGSKQGIMSDIPSLPSPVAASLFTSPRLYSPKNIADPEAAEDVESGATGLGLLDALTNDDSFNSTSRPEKRMVVFGSQLKIQIPPPPPPPTSQSSSISPMRSSGESLHSPTEFGIKTRNSQLALLPGMLSSPPRFFTGRLPPPEMELSEDYTRVILHGPNPRTTHIFDNCIIESCTNGFATPMSERRSSSDRPGYAVDDFLSFCYGCKKKFGSGEDIYMYRGDKAFCSHECRHHEMLLDEGKDKC
ncbi:FCS-Like Zinc finger 8-like isoform X2 [Musa acuminata AAA Group]|uniref:FCS-Like Zinc finger 8-like isoform X2 n=1 Tax=Musa acuminata AAA Group TaxID=214697 RepID=UPI0031D93BA3